MPNFSVLHGSRNRRNFAAVMKKINYFSIVGFTALYVVTVFATAFLGFLHPLCWVGFPVVAALLGAFSYLCVASHWQRFGAGALLGLAFGLFLLATGEGGLPAFATAIIAGLLSDVLRLFVGNTSKKGATIAYPVLSLGVIGWILPLWTRTQWYHDGAVEEMGVDYAEGLMPLAQWWVFLLLVIATMVVGYIGIRLAISWLKSTVLRFDEQPGLLSKFWNTNARPQGWMGRMALWEMNLTHTPMAPWNLSLIDFQPDWTILDVGCGGGKNIARMLKRCPQGQVYGIDYSEESVAYSIKNNRQHIGTRCFIQQGNVMHLPYEDAKFDLITAYETVYFWPDLKKAFSEVFRVLKPDGIFTFSYGDESSSTMRYWANEIEAMRILPADEISQLLTDAGFANLQIARKGGYTINFRMRKP